MPNDISESYGQLQQLSLNNKVGAVVSTGLDPLAAVELLSDTYESDSITLLVQSPEIIFLYWQHARSPFETLRKAFGEVAARYELTVRLFDVESGEVSLKRAAAEYTQWFDVRAGRVYRAEVGLFAPERPFIRLLSSGVVRTPQRSVSQRADSAPPFGIPSIAFARLLAEAGYAEDAVEVARETVDHNVATRASEVAPETHAVWNASDVNFGARSFARRRPTSPPQVF